MLEIILSVIFIFSFIILVLILNLIKNKKSDLKYIQIIPDYDHLFSENASNRFLDEIHSYLKYGSKVILKTRLSNEGIKFIIGSDEKKIKIIENTLKAIDVNLEIKTLDYQKIRFKKYTGYYLYRKFKLRQHFLFNKLDHNSELLKSLVFESSKIKLDEVIDLDLTISSYKGWYLKFARLLSLNNKRIFKSRYRFLNLAYYLILIIILFLKFILKLLLARPSRFTPKSDHINTYMIEKINQNYFRSHLEICLYSKYKYRLNELDQDIELIASKYNNFRYLKKRTRKFNDYLPFLCCSKQIYSSLSLAGIFHLIDLNRPDRFYYLNHFKKLDLSIDRRADYLNQNYNQVLGKWFDNTSSLDVVLTEADRKQHLLICGATGSGKSTLMYNMILNDIKKNKSLALIDPHGDLSDKILSNISEEQKNKVIYFNPSKDSTTYSIDLFERYSKPNTKEYELETELIIENLISVFNKIFSKESIMGHRIEYILRNSLKTVLLIDHPSLLKVFNLINDPNYLTEVLKEINDINLLNFWQNEFKRAGDYQKVKMSFGVTTKLGRFLFSDVAKKVFSESKQKLNINQIINNNNFLIFKLAKGEIGEENSSILGTLILTKIQLGGLFRSKQKYIDRKDFYLYVDEFQNFASYTFTDMLSEARKFKIFLTIAEQSLSQHDSQITSMMLANIGNLAVFKTPSPIDQRLLIKYFEPYLKPVDLRHIPILNYYFVSTYRQNDSPINISIENLS